MDWNWKPSGDYWGPGENDDLTSFDYIEGVFPQTIQKIIPKTAFGRILDLFLAAFWHPKTSKMRPNSLPKPRKKRTWMDKFFTN